MALWLSLSSPNEAHYGNVQSGVMSLTDNVNYLTDEQFGYTAGVDSMIFHPSRFAYRPRSPRARLPGSTPKSRRLDPDFDFTLAASA
jgi:hypothetical protein